VAQTKTMTQKLKKYILILSTIFAFTFVSFAEENEKHITIHPSLWGEPTMDKDSVFEIVEKMPEFSGNLRDFAIQRLPFFVGDHFIRERIVVQFVVNTDGSITDIQVLRGSTFHPPFDQEAVQVVKSMPNWIPGEHRGQKVRVRYTMVIRFTNE